LIGDEETVDEARALIDALDQTPLIHNGVFHLPTEKCQGRRGEEDSQGVL
jgi:hypothetical protein